MAACSDEIVVQSDTLTCSICLEIYVNPRTLPCLHSFCQACLVGYITKCRTDTKTGAILCPLCRAEFKTDVNLDKAEEWANRLPLNYTLVSILNSRKLKMADKEKYCQPCLRENIQVPASVFCYDCEEELCESCGKMHKKIKSLSDHRLCKIAEGKCDILKLEFLRSLTRCPDHQAEEVRYLCEDHDQVCCNECAIVKHRKCESLISIANEISATDTAGQDISCRLESLKTYTNDFLDFEKKYNIAVETSKTKMKEKLKGLKGTIDEAFEKLEKTVEHDIEGKYSVFLKKMEINVCEIKTIRRELDESVNKLNTVKELGKNNHLFLLHRRLNEVCVKLGSELSQISFENKICCLEENSSAEASRLVETAFRVSTEKCDIPMPEFPKLRNNEKPKLVSMNIAKHVLVCEENLGNLGQYVRSCTWMKDMVVVACQASVLGLFEMADEKFNQCYKKQCSAQPWGLVSIDNERLVVCFPYGKKLEIIKLEGKLLQTVKTINTDNDVWDIALMSTEEIITLSRSGSLDIYTLEGTKVRALPLNSGSKESVVNAFSINYDRKIGVVYISAHGLHKILALKADGTVIFEYGHQNLQHPWRIDISINGDIYVPMFGTNAVHVLDRQGQFVRELQVPGPGFCINLRREKQEFLFISFRDNQSFLHLYRY